MKIESSSISMSGTSSEVISNSKEESLKVWSDEANSSKTNSNNIKKQLEEFIDSLELSAQGIFSRKI
jgi:hypothetical protein